MRNKKFWTAADRKILTEMFPDNYTEAICERLHRSYSSVSNQAYIMGLKKDETLLKKCLLKGAEMLKSKGVAYRYPKGHIPQNKGKKVSPETYRKMSPTMFKSGHVPHNAIPAGREVIRKDSKGTPYIFIKIAGERKLKPKHVYLWEGSIGAIAKGFNVVFKDGNTLNCTIENLECISDAELMLRNSIHKYPEEVIPSLVLNNKLKNKIKKLCGTN